MTTNILRDAINRATSNDPPSCEGVGHVDSGEARLITDLAVCDRGQEGAKVTPEEAKLIGDLFERQPRRNHPGTMVTMGCPETPSITMDSGAVRTFNAFFGRHNLLYGETLKQAIQAKIDASGPGPKRSGPPENARSMSYVLIKDDSPVDGLLTEAYVDRAKGEFYVSVTPPGRGGGRVQWFGPTSLGEGSGGSGEIKIENNTTDRQVNMSPTGNKVRISVGIGAGVSLAGGQIGLKIDGHVFSVPTQQGGDARAALNNLRNQIYNFGYGVEEKALQGIDTIELEWTIKSGAIKPSTHKIVSGTVSAESPAPAIPGPSLKLAAPITVGDVTVSSIKLSDRFAALGSKLEAHGRLDVGLSPAEIHPAIRFVALSGASNLTNGEPLFDGKVFRNARGEQLPTGYYNRPAIADAPAIVYVFNAGNVFVGALGGFIAPHTNPFHGFRGNARFELPTQADRDAIQIRNGKVFDKTSGKELPKLAEKSDGAAADGILREWFLDFQPRGGSKIYELHTGGFAGFLDTLMGVAKLP